LLAAWAGREMIPATKNEVTAMRIERERIMRVTPGSPTLGNLWVKERPRRLRQLGVVAYRGP
jgi:hypothetical protein